MHLAAMVGILAEFPDDTLNSEQLELVIIGLMVLCVVAIVFVLRTMQKMVTRVVMALALAGIIGGLWLQREALQDCTGECSCRVFGQDIRVPDPDAFCPNP